MGSDVFQEGEYKSGVTFGILCMAVNNGFQLLFSVLSWAITDHSKMKWSMFAANLILFCMLILVFWIRMKYVYFLIVGLIGFAQVVVFSVPSSIVSIVVPYEELGINFGLLNSFAVIGQLISNLPFAALIAFSVSEKKSTYLIGFSSIFALIAALLSLFVVQPSIADTENYNYLDEDSDNYVKFSVLD